MGVLAFVEHHAGTPRGTAAEVVTAARSLADELGTTVTAFAVGAPGTSSGLSELGRYGADRVLVAEHDDLEGYSPEGWTRALTDAVLEGARAVLLAATSTGRDLAPRMAAALDVPLASDVTALDVDEGVVQVTRPMYSGKAIARLAIRAEPAVATIRPNVFKPIERDASGEVEVITPEIDADAWGVRVVGFEAAEGGSVDVAAASIVVSGGRGMKDPENWHLLERLRDALGSDAALGASRAVVDAGWRPHGEQVGQTGKTVSPKLYFAIGISGAIQHLAGMRTSQTIVAVNKDADAPIFQVADYGIVGDLFDVVPRLTEAVEQLKSD